MVRKKVLLSAERFRVAVCRYASGERHTLHTDLHSRISFLIRGDYREEGRSGFIRMQPGQVLLKSRRAKHADEFGRLGAAIAAIEFITDDPFDAVSEPDLWRPRCDGYALRHAITFLEAALAGDGGAVETAGVDLISAAGGESDRSRNAPSWLDQLKEALEEESLSAVNVATRAKKAGVHPAHASRLFRRCYGASITEHAQAHSVRRAIGPLAADLALSEVALAAGFYDQSHMTRVFRRVTGRTPGAYRALLAAAG